MPLFAQREKGREWEGGGRQCDRETETEREKETDRDREKETE